MQQEKSSAQTQGRKKVRKPMRPGATAGLQIAIDIVMAGICLCIYALFHHVLPKTIHSMPIVDSSRIPQIQTPADNPSDPDYSFASGLEGLVNAEKRYASSPLPERRVTKLEVLETDTLKLVMNKVQYGWGNNMVTYYAADLFITSVENFHTAVAKNEDDKLVTATVDNLAFKKDAVFAVSGDYFKNSEIGFIVRDGELYRNEPTPNDLCLLYLDGSMEIIDGTEFSSNDAIAKGVWQAWSFGPSLLTEEGLPKTKNEEFNVNGSNKDIGSPFHSQSAMFSEHPRNLIGYVEPGHYIFILIDGRNEGYSRGVDFVDESQIAYDEGCVLAYNLDGGRSAMMVYENEIVNLPYKGGRPISDIIYFTAPDKESGDVKD